MRPRPYAPRPTWWRRRSLRARLTVATTTLVALALGAGALLLLTALSDHLYTAIDGAAYAQAQAIAALVDTGRVPDPLSVSGVASAQVVDAAGRVREASAGGDRLASLLGPADIERVRAGHAVGLDGSRLGTADPLRVVGVPAGPASDPQTVVVAVSVAQLQGSLAEVRAGLSVGAPLLVAATALICWSLVGSALRPVDALRRGAEEISSARDSGRLPVPEARDEVASLASTLNAMLDRLAAAQARQRAFVSDAAHELRSPLASTRTQVEVALAHPELDVWTETATGVLAETERMSRLVDDLLMLARMDEGPSPHAPRPAVDAAVLADEVAGRGYRVPVRRSGAGPAWVSAEPGQLGRVLGNLVDNAARHATTEVSVAVVCHDDAVVLQVADDGPGIPPEDRARVFERFTRLDAARARDSGGSGLGLAIVAEVVRALGGSVALDDAAPGPGLVATVTLPLAAPPAAGPDREGASPLETPRAPSTTRT